MARLAEVLQEASCKYQKKSDENCEIVGMTFDFRQVKPGDLFICISGLHSDGHHFATQAIEKGAVAILAEKEMEVPEGIAVAVVQDTRKAMAQAAAAFYHLSRIHI